MMSTGAKIIAVISSYKRNEDKIQKSCKLSLQVKSRYKNKDIK